MSMPLKRTGVLTLQLPPSYAHVAVKQCPRRFKFRTSLQPTCCSSALLSACASATCALARSSCPRSCCGAALYSGTSACTSALGCNAAARRVRASACGRIADQGASQDGLVAGLMCVQWAAVLPLQCARASACRGGCATCLLTMKPWTLDHRSKSETATLQPSVVSFGRRDGHLSGHIYCCLQASLVSSAIQATSIGCLELCCH